MIVPLIATVIALLITICVVYVQGWRFEELQRNSEAAVAERDAKIRRMGSQIISIMNDYHRLLAEREQWRTKWERYGPQSIP